MKVAFEVFIVLFGYPLVAEPAVSGVRMGSYDVCVQSVVVLEQR